MKNNEMSGVSPQKDTQKSLKYKVDKMIFIIEPVYKESGESVKEILIKLM